MKYKNIIAVSLLLFVGLSGGGTTQEPSTLSIKQKEITKIASLTAKSDLITLDKVLDEALDSGMTVNEAKEYKGSSRRDPMV